MADAKLDDIPNTVQRAVANLCDRRHPPVGITVHTNSGPEALRRAQQEAGLVKILGVTVLTSLTEADSQRMYKQTIAQAVGQRAQLAAEVGVKGLVASAQELELVKANPRTSSLFTMIPGIRPANFGHQDQKRTATPAEAIAAGADLLVIGRPIHGAAEPAQAFKAIVAEMEAPQSFDRLSLQQRRLPLASRW